MLKVRIVCEVLERVKSCESSSSPRLVNDESIAVMPSHALSSLFPCTSLANCCLLQGSTRAHQQKYATSERNQPLHRQVHAGRCMWLVGAEQHAVWSIAVQCSPDTELVQHLAQERLEYLDVKIQLIATAWNRGLHWGGEVKIVNQWTLPMPHIQFLATSPTSKPFPLIAGLQRTHRFQGFGEGASAQGLAPNRSGPCRGIHQVYTDRGRSHCCGMGVGT